MAMHVAGHACLAGRRLSCGQPQGCAECGLISTVLHALIGRRQYALLHCLAPWLMLTRNVLMKKAHVHVMKDVCQEVLTVNHSARLSVSD